MRQKELIEISITGVLIVVMLFIIGNSVKKTLKPNLRDTLPKAVDLTTAPVAGEVKKIVSDNLYNFLEKQAQLLVLKRDPFTVAPIISEMSTQSEVALTGILWDKDDPLAIMNGRIVKEGSRIGDKTVMEIKPDRVILSDAGDLLEIKFKQ